MNMGDEVYIIPIFAIVVDIPAIKGKAPQTPQPIEPKKNNFKNSLLKSFFFLKISFRKKGANIRKTVSHLQKANEIGGTYSTPPRATIILVAINIG
jgi:hypothetical protein